MDKLDEIFRLQKELDEHIAKRDGFKNFSREEWMQKIAMAMIVETSEFVEETNYKWWKNAKPINEDALKEELVDILHFYISLCLRAGVSSDELFRVYLGKNAVNHHRQEG